MPPIAGPTDEPRQTRFRADHGALTGVDLQTLRCSLRRRAQGQALLLSRPTSVHGVRATHLARELARYRSLSASTQYEALSSRHPRQRSPQHSGQRQRYARLAHLLRLRPTPNRDCETALCRGNARHRVEGHGLRTRLDINRSVPVGVFLGALPIDESRGEASHVARSAWQHSVFHLHQRRSVSRRQRPRPPRARTWCLLRNGPSLYRLREIGPAQRRWQLLRYPREVELQSTTPSTAPLGSSATRPWCSPAFTRARASKHHCAASSSTIPKPASGSYSSQTTSHCQHSRSPSCIDCAGVWNSFSSGSNNIYVSRRSSAQPRTR